MNRKRVMMDKQKWLILGVGVGVVVIIGGAIYFPPALWGTGQFNEMAIPGGSMLISTGSEVPGTIVNLLPRQPIRPAAEVVQIRATGSITLQEQEMVVAKVKALIKRVYVKVGQVVNPGDILMEFDTDNLEREAEEARFNLAKAQSELKKLLAPPDPAKLAAAQQKVLIAQEEVETVKAGPTSVELKATETEVFVAWAKYNGLVAGKTEDELASERIALRQAENNLKRAQEDYDSVSWRVHFEITEERAKALEAATTAYETAKASYNKAAQPAAEKDLREAYSEALKAQEKLEKLRQKPTKKELAEAELKLLEAQKELDQLNDGADSDKLAEAKMEVQKKELLVAEAEAKLANAKLAAPFAGTVVGIDAKAGKTAEVNDKMVTVANLQSFKLTVNVPETKINRLEVGQEATITLDALPDHTFPGKISYISPIQQSDSSPVSYAVIVQLDVDSGAGILSGMTAVVNFVDESLKEAWLVPTTAIQPKDDKTMVTVYRNDEPSTVVVKPGIKQGEWTVVYSPDLQAGDEVEAELSSFLNEDQFGMSPAMGGVVISSEAVNEEP